MVRIIDRADLYEAVWATPLSHLAKGYGISDVALKKACTRLGVPTPPRGYWARLRHGHEVYRPPLPPPVPDAPTTYEVVEVEDIPDGEERPQEGAGPCEAPRPLPPGLDPPPTVVVARSLRNPDPFVAATRAALGRHGTDEFGRMRSHDALLAVDVHPASVPRALRLVDAVIREARRLGFELRESGSGGHAEFVVEGENVAFGVYERSRQERIPESERKSWLDGRVRYHPSGVLELGVGESYSAKYRRSWRDTTSVRVEERVGDFLVGVYEEAVRQKEERERREAYRRAWVDKKVVERKRAEDAAREQARREHLEEQAASWARSREVSAFIDAAEVRASQVVLTDEGAAELDAWVRWAREHAARLDPFAKGLPHQDPDMSVPGP